MPALRRHVQRRGSCRVDSRCLGAGTQKSLDRPVLPAGCAVVEGGPTCKRAWTNAGACSDPRCGTTPDWAQYSLQAEGKVRASRVICFVPALP